MVWLECFLFFVWFLFIAAFDIQNAMLALALAPEVGRTDESKILVCRRRTRYDSMIKSGPCWLAFHRLLLFTGAQLHLGYARIKRKIRHTECWSTLMHRPRRSILSFSPWIAAAAAAALFTRRLASLSWPIAHSGHAIIRPAYVVLQRQQQQQQQQN